MTEYVYFVELISYLFFFLLEKKETDASSVAESFNEEKAVSLTNNYFPTSSEVSDKCFC